jgi:restriction system protein
MDTSNVIQYHQMLLPTLEALQPLGGSANIEELNSTAIDIMQLPEKMRNVLHKEDGTLTEVEFKVTEG